MAGKNRDKFQASTQNNNRERFFAFDGSFQDAMEAVLGRQESNGRFHEVITNGPFTLTKENPRFPDSSGTRIYSNASPTLKVKATRAENFKVCFEHLNGERKEIEIKGSEMGVDKMIAIPFRLCYIMFEILDTPKVPMNLSFELIHTL